MRGKREERLKNEKDVLSLSDSIWITFSPAECWLYELPRNTLSHTLSVRLGRENRCLPSCRLSHTRMLWTDIHRTAAKGAKGGDYSTSTEINNLHRDPDYPSYGPGRTPK